MSDTSVDVEKDRKILALQIREKAHPRSLQKEDLSVDDRQVFLR